ncbi:IclR family transcriptional regulator [Fodinisporobacter ferrooxydans]|uniref:IclR family transcriptional regulator n=1 Tax=Fodinisporobacter ferrooxydans TaxID=2901836 RepID=A0ABY4CLG1_9BACL|nr:IclR family transcriptional regulator [Alicyclobacillaceae bacterium MYW30-H2]
MGEVEMLKKSKDSDSLRTVQRALDILNCFSLQETELTLTEIANKISLAKSTTTRLLGTLEQNGLIKKNQETLKYKLGSRLYYLGYIAGKSIQIREISHPFMKKLRDETTETVNLYLLENEFRVCVDQCESVQSLRHLVKIGERLPLWAGAGGKVLLAYQDREFQKQIFRYVDSEQRLQKLQSELSAIIEEGYASSQDEREVGLSAIAAPIFGVDGEVSACISVSGPTQRFTPDVMERIKVSLKQCASGISEHNGYMERKAANEK